jgi:hypothetical protein
MPDRTPIDAGAFDQDSVVGVWWPLSNPKVVRACIIRNEQLVSRLLIKIRYHSREAIIGFGSDRFATIPSVYLTVSGYLPNTIRRRIEKLRVAVSTCLWSTSLNEDLRIIDVIDFDDLRQMITIEITTGKRRGPSPRSTGTPQSLPPKSSITVVDVNKIGTHVCDQQIGKTILVQVRDFDPLTVPSVTSLGG